jgi:hypothetical protein
MLFEFGATIGTMKEAAEKSILPTRRVPKIGMSTRQSPVREVLEQKTKGPKAYVAESPLMGLCLLFLRHDAFSAAPKVAGSSRLSFGFW